jgi:hypothetical protein
VLIDEQHAFVIDGNDETIVKLRDRSDLMSCDIRDLGRLYKTFSRVGGAAIRRRATVRSAAYCRVL